MDDPDEPTSPAPEPPPDPADYCPDCHLPLARCHAWQYGDHREADLL